MYVIEVDGITVHSVIAGRELRHSDDYLRFRRTPAASGCGFCEHATAGDEHPEVVETGGTMLVVMNRYPYAVWDSQRVVDHYMIIPTRHLYSLGELTPEELADYTALLARYETNGYSTYTRSQGNAGRSMAHLHTHLFGLGSHIDI